MGSYARPDPDNVEEHALERFMERCAKPDCAIAGLPEPHMTEVRMAFHTILTHATPELVEEDVANEQAVWRIASVLVVTAPDGRVKTVLPRDSKKPNRRPER